MKVEFKKATKEKVKLRLALLGPAGSGKTYGALSLAEGIGKKIAVLDTENGTASLYSDRFDFQTLTMNPPYTVAKYIAGIDAAEAAGFDVLIIDSLSHAWAGEGGLLDKKTALDSRGGNSFTNWASITKEHEQLKTRILHPKLHLITTLRVKTEYVLEANDKGRQVPKKVGLAPVQREGLEYEFDVVFEVAMDHSVVATKDRTSLFDNRILKLSKDLGVELSGWLSKGTLAPAANTAKKEVDLNDPVAIAKLSRYIVQFGESSGKSLAEIDTATLLKMIDDNRMKEDAPEVTDFLNHAIPYISYLNGNESEGFTI